MRALRWLASLFRRPPVLEVECERNHTTVDPHVVTAELGFDAGDLTAGTTLSATYCPEHCPGGCDKETVHA